jgi:hypothetical protein
MVEAVPPVKPPSGQLRHRPVKLRADKTYDISRSRRFLRGR